MNSPVTIRVVLPAHLRSIAGVAGEVQLQVGAPASLQQALDELERVYPALRGTIRDHVTKQRRPFLRFFACEEDLTHDPPETPLPEPVLRGDEPLFVIGAVAGGGPFARAWPFAEPRKETSVQ
jgi:sulfur-carrier protein